jgi:tetratricopeptide (TPR) repeat protein
VAAALVFASWDVIGYAFLGLIFAGLWLPLAIALYAMHRRTAAPAGVAIAWAGLLKLFPFILLLPAAARLARAGLHRTSNKNSNGLSRRWSQLLVWSAVATAVLALAAIFSGRSWMDFFHKIMIQFATKGTTANNVSLGKGLSTLGIEWAPLAVILSMVSLATLTAMFLRDTDDDLTAALPRRSLVLLAATGWVAPHWLNYYSVAALLLLPLVARRHRVGASLAAFATAVAFILPEFGDPLLVTYPALRTLKLAPYIIVPAWLVFLELRPTELSKRARRITAAACALCLLVAVGAAWRVHTIKSLSDTGAEYINRGDPNSALEKYQRLVRLSPRSIDAYTGMAVAHVMLGDSLSARSHFENVKRLDPDNARARQNYGRFLLKTGSVEEAAQEFEVARGLQPFNESILYDLARARVTQGQRVEAESLLIRARELQPADKAISDLLSEVQTP